MTGFDAATDELPLDVTLVTPTRRLAHHLRARHDAACLAAGLQAWQSPDIATWSELVRRAFDADRDTGRTTCRWLAPTHAQLVWQQLARSDERLQSIIAPASIGAMALHAWTLLHEYLIPADALTDAASPEVQVFAQWRLEYVRWLRRGNWRDAAEAPAEVGPLPSGTRLMLAGFDVLTPQQVVFFERMLAAGVVVEHRAPSAAVPSMPRVVACNDFADEVETAARWAARRLQDMPNQRIAIVVRGLAQERQRVRRILDRVLVPAATIAGGPAPESAAYELAAARALAERPVIAAMLGWLDALAGEATFTTCTALLRNAFDGASASESLARAALDARLRRNESADLTLVALAKYATGRGCAEFAGLLRRGLDRTQSWARRRLPSHWVREFAALALDLGWPGSHADSTEHQAIQRWQSLLAEFGASDDVTGPLTVRSALSHLRQLADDALFEPQEVKAPLVVIDPQTCAGMRFDATWVTGLEASHWPEPAAADPFLPRDWQVRSGIPGASPELAAAAAARTLARLQRDGGETIFSIPGFEDAAPLLPSPLVLSLPPAEKPPLWQGLAVAPAVFAARPALERLTDGALPGIATYDLAHGGTRVIELQAACPFRAAVELRLGGREFEEPASGIDATERGNVAHAVLKALWDELREQRVLAALSRERRLQLVQGYIERELAPLRAAASGVLQHLLELEQRWLEARIMELLDADLARPPFAVADTELAASVEVGGLRVRLQLDRVDRLGDGSLAIIDYKTGANAAPADWMGERPRSPQLPLYVRALDDAKVGAIAFARVRTGATQYTGYAHDHTLFPGLQGFVPNKKPFQDYSSWGELLATWRRRLDGIAGEYGAGDARLAPDPKSACRRCHLPALCRIEEAGVEEGAEQVDDGL